MQKNKNILINARKCHKIPDGCRVVLEGLSLLPAVQMLERFTYVWSCHCLMVCRSFLLYIFFYIYYWVKFFYQWSKFLTGSQIFLPPNKTPPIALKWPYKANFTHFIYTSKKPVKFLSSFYIIFILYISSSFFLLIIIYIYILVIIRVIIYILVLVISLLQALIVYTKR